MEELGIITRNVVIVKLIYQHLCQVVNASNQVCLPVSRVKYTQ